MPCKLAAPFTPFGEYKVLREWKQCVWPVVLQYDGRRVPDAARCVWVSGFVTNTPHVFVIASYESNGHSF
jgi:hypothetical protein